jgi:hypothetical protein
MAGMHIIIGMPPHIIIIGAPMAIIAVMASQRSFMRGIIDASIGVIFIIIPSLVISQDILHIIGIMPPPIMGIIIGIIMPFIIGMGIMLPFIIGIMPFIIGMFMGIGIMPPFIMGIMPFIGMFMLPGMFIGIPIIDVPLIIGMAFMEPSSGMAFGCVETWCIEPFGVRAFTSRTVLACTMHVQSRRTPMRTFHLP